MKPRHCIRIHVRELRWEVEKDGVTRPMIDWLCTKERAIAHAFELAREIDDGLPYEVIVERSDGSVEELVAA